MQRFNLFVPDRILSGFLSLSDKTGYSTAELMRRMFGHCLQDQVLDVLVPEMSGVISTGKRSGDAGSLGNPT